MWLSNIILLWFAPARAQPFIFWGLGRLKRKIVYLALALVLCLMLPLTGWGHNRALPGVPWKRWIRSPLQ